MRLLNTCALLISGVIPDDFLRLNQVSVFVDVAFNHQVAVSIMGWCIVGDNSAGDAKSSGNWQEKSFQRDATRPRGCDRPTCTGHGGKHPALPVTNRLAGLCVPVTQDFHTAPPEQRADASLVATCPFPQHYPFIIVTVHLGWREKDPERL